MATVRSNIPHGSILAQLRQRQMDEYQAAEQKRKQKASFVNQLSQLGGMAAGAALGTTIFPGMGTAAGMMAGAGLGGTGGGLLGNAMTGTPVSMNQGIGALMQVGGLMQRQEQLGINQQRANIYGQTGIADPVAYSGAPTIANRNLQFGVPQTNMQRLSPIDAMSMGMVQSPTGGYTSPLVASLGQAGQEATWYADNPGMGDYDIMNTPGGTTTITREIGNRKATIESGGLTKVVETNTIPGGTETRTFVADEEAQNREFTEIEAYLISQGQAITPANIAAVRAMMGSR